MNNNAMDIASFDVYSECAPNDRPVMSKWIRSRMKSALETSQRGSIIVVARDKNGNEVGRNEIGAPSEQLRALADEEDEDPPVTRLMIKER